MFFCIFKPKGRSRFFYGSASREIDSDASSSRWTLSLPLPPWIRLAGQWQPRSSRHQYAVHTSPPPCGFVLCIVFAVALSFSWWGKSSSTSHRERCAGSQALLSDASTERHSGHAFTFSARIAPFLPSESKGKTFWLQLTRRHVPGWQGPNRTNTRILISQIPFAACVVCCWESWQLEKEWWFGVKFCSATQEEPSK